MSIHRDADLAPRSDEDDLWICSGRVREHIGPAPYTRARCILCPVQRWKRLPREHENRGLMTKLHDVAVRLDHFVRIAGAEGDQPGMALKEARCSTGW